MITLCKLIHHTLIILTHNLRTRADHSYALRCEVERLTREVDTEKRRADSLLEENTELHYQLDDANRLIQQASASLGRHVVEGFRMNAEIMFLRQRNTQLEATVQYRKQVLAGSMLTRQWVNVGNKLKIREGVAAP